jgi:hypothetical protein
MIAPSTLDALAEVANALGFTLHRHAFAVDIGIDGDYAQLATRHGRCRLGSDPNFHTNPVEFEGTPRECAAFLIGWRERGVQTFVKRARLP